MKRTTITDKADAIIGYFKLEGTDTMTVDRIRGHFGWTKKTVLDAATNLKERNIGEAYENPHWEFAKGKMVTKYDTVISLFD